MSEWNKIDHFIELLKIERLSFPPFFVSLQHEVVS